MHVYSRIFNAEGCLAAGAAPMKEIEDVIVCGDDWLPVLVWADANYHWYGILGQFELELCYERISTSINEADLKEDVIELDNGCVMLWKLVDDDEMERIMSNW